MNLALIELNNIDPNYKNYDSFVYARPLMEEEMEFQFKLYKLLTNTKEINEKFFMENRIIKKVF
ncbi:MAG: hypothetical protein H7A23_05075 [Leptospiraceae bacterium]|nr:hypothetical protein [Leptospiraceae bacterium]MCP5493907.1 hypothetical protein [Leptospiraceae bacterium]